MSKIRLHGSSSGHTEVAPAAAAGNNTVTLPNSAGTLLLTDGSAASLTQIPAANIVGVATAGLTKGGGGFGKILQVVQVVHTATVSTGVTIGDGRVTCSTLHGSAANCTQIPAANIVGVCTSGFSRTGGFGGITLADSWRVSSSFSPSAGQNTITANWERDDYRFEKIGDGLNESSGIFTFPETGKYLFHWNHSAYDTDARRYVGVLALLSIDNGSNYATIAETYDSMSDPSTSNGFSAGAMTFIVDVTDTSQFKLAWNTSLSANVTFDANTNQQRTGFSVIRIGDT